MFKQGIVGAILVGVVLGLSLPMSAMEGSRLHRRHHKPHHRHHEHYQQYYSGFQVGIVFGGRYGYRHYPHGHHLHVHGTHCPVVIETHVYHNAYAAPVWHVHHYRHHAPAPQTILRIVVASHHGDIYVDGRYLGQSRTFRHGRVQVPVAPGRHTVQLHLGGAAYTRQVNVKAGSTAVVEARLRR